MVEQPSGTVTLVFTDIEGSTRLLHELGQEAYREALVEHRRVVREACVRQGGYEVNYEGDSFFYAFRSADEAVKAIGETMRALEDGPIRIRVGIHTGEPGLDPPKYVGVDVHLAARVMAAGHGGQVLLTRSTGALLEVDLKDLGEHRLKDIGQPVWLYQLGQAEFPPLRSLGASAADPQQNTIYMAIGARIYASSNAGRNWRLISRRLRFTPNQYATSLAAGGGNVFATFWGTEAIYKSADDGGTWTRTWPASTPNPGLVGDIVAVDPARPTTVYAVSSTADATQILRSTNSGRTWTVVG